ncbi:ABC1 kinase family protein [candidate division CSSED10-310 bacterium]|uniref:ABC1 kinase family protein n=1 Tax=candidate division CSSED10-310 bacterium TaxID=2855610 RepID=A0ABV6YXY2_UNCC1
MAIGQTYKNIQRMQTILNILFKHGFGHFIERLNLQNFISYSKISSLVLRSETVTPSEQFTFNERFRMALEELGPTFVKFGQVLSSRPDFVPEAMTLELKKLQEQVPPFSYYEVKSQIESEFNQPLSEIFSDFSEKPLASASIAQVHQARLEDDTEVVVKVQRPKIDIIIDTDLNILLNLALLLERYVAESKAYQPVALVEEFAKAIKRELDFNLEAANTARFYHNFFNDDTIRIPMVYWSLTSKKVLTMEQLIGFKLDNIAELETHGFDCTVLAQNLGESFLMQVLDHGFFHADPHPGNLVAIIGNRIGFMDFGMIGRLDEETKESLATTVIALLQRDYDRLTNEFLQMGFLSEKTNLKSFRDDLIDFIEPYHGRSLKNIEIGAVISKAVEIAVKHKAHVPPDLMLLGKALLTIEGVGRQLDPELDLVELGTPFSFRIIRRKLSPARFLKSTYHLVQESGDLFRILPKQLKGIFTKLEKDNLKVIFHHYGLENFIRELDRASNKITVGIIISALILSSSLLINAGTGPYLFSYPAFGLIGFSLAAFFGIWLVVTIVRSGRF